MAIAHSPFVVVDCPDAGALARFYGALLDREAIVDDDGSWARLGGEGAHLCFQRVDDYRPPAWPGQEHPQQMHVDVLVADIDVAEPQVLALGATRHDVQPSTDGDFRVFLDPAGHPFCLCADDAPAS